MERFSEGMKACVTGASGFIGHRLVNALYPKFEVIRVLSRRTDVRFEPNVQVIAGDLTAEDCPLAQFLENCDVLFHCAGEIHNPEKMKALHVEGTRRLLKAVEIESSRRGKAIHIVHLSSVGVYGPPNVAHEDRIITEDSTVHPLGEYEVTKAFSDQMVVEAGQGKLMTYTIVRPSNVFGVGMPNQSLFKLGEMIAKNLFFYIGKREAIATYVHVNDVVSTLLLCATDEKAKGQIFNVSNDCLLEEVIESIANAKGVKSPRLRVPEIFARVLVTTIGRLIRLPLTHERINALVIQTRYPTNKLKKTLGFFPQISVPEAMGKMNPSLPKPGC